MINHTAHQTHHVRARQLIREPEPHNLAHGSSHNFGSYTAYDARVAGSG